MDIELYRNFLAIIERGSMTAAAEQMHISQPSLSKQLKVLESYYGSPLMLLKRGKKEIILTEAGRVLYQKAKYICSLEDAAKSEIEDMNEGVTGVLRLSVAYSRSPLFISRSIKGFSKLYPKVTYEIYEAIASAQTRQLLNGIAELGITTTTLDQPEQFDVLFSRPESIVAVFNSESRWLDGKKNLILTDLKDIPLSLSGGGADTFRKICRASHFTPFVMSVSTTKLTAVQWARENMAVAIIPSELNEEYGENLVVKPINDRRFKLQKNVVKVKGQQLSKVAEKFIEFYREQRHFEKT